MDMNNILTVAQVAERNGTFTEAKLRWWIFNADQNGFGVCMIRIGGRVYIDIEAFGKWLESQRVEVLAVPEAGDVEEQ